MLQLFLLFISWLSRHLKSVFLRTSALMFSSGFSSGTFEKPWYLIPSCKAIELFLGFFFHKVKIFRKAFASEASKHLTLHNQLLLLSNRCTSALAMVQSSSPASKWCWSMNQLKHSVCGELQGRRVPILQLLSSMRGQEFVCIPKLFEVYWWKFPMK